MKRCLIVPLLAASLGAAAQAPAGKEASAAEGRAVTAIVECLAPGLPEDWRQAVMVVELARPGDETGEVRYLVTRGNSETTESFLPCDIRKPTTMLFEVRREQPAARRGWTGARLTIYRDGKFGLKYDYPR